MSEDLGMIITTRMCLTEAEFLALSPEERERVEGRPCPWCGQIIKRAWSRETRVGEENGEMIGHCPHCDREFMLSVQGDEG